MPVMIAGMHRSGTSMIARLLNLSGLYLGREDELYAGAADNAEGFWEHRSFVELNDVILTHFGGGWDLPPTFPIDWDERPDVQPFVERAKALAESFDGHASWGWKDPRNCLTIGLWRRLIPDLKIVLCVRHPNEVAQSLQKRGYSSHPFAWNLWKIYHRSLLASVPLESLVVTHYDSYFASGQIEISRVASSIGLTPSQSRLQEAFASVSTNLRHNRSAAAGGPALPSDVQLLYQDLSAAAGVGPARAGPGSGAAPGALERPEQPGRAGYFLRPFFWKGRGTPS